MKDALADLRVVAHELPLVGAEGAGLLEDHVGDRHLSDVVQQAGQARPLDVLVRQPELPRQRVGELGHADRVRTELGMALGQRAQKHAAGLLARRHA